MVGSSSAFAKSLTVYGKIHVSADAVDKGSDKEYAIGSNSTRIGFKGDKNIKYNLRAVWKLESDIDASGERHFLKARNRYLGLQHKRAGTLLVGVHDTPYKTLGGKAGVFHDTIGERRGILGAGNGSNKINIRGKNSVLYVTPKLGGFHARAMYSVGNDSSDKLESNPFYSLSALYEKKMFYVGVAYEDQVAVVTDSDKNIQSDTKGLRVSTGIKIGGTKVNAIYEKLSSDTNKPFDRNAYGGSVAQRFGDTTFKAQLFMSGDYSGTDDSSAMIYAVGVDHKLDKAFTTYLVLAGVSNKDNAKVPLAGSGHGEKFAPSAAGENLKGVSVGMIYKFK